MYILKLSRFQNSSQLFLTLYEKAADNRSKMSSYYACIFHILPLYRVVKYEICMHNKRTSWICCLLPSHTKSGKVGCCFEIYSVSKYTYLLKITMTNYFLAMNHFNFSTLPAAYIQLDFKTE